jgi:hypothetical protein
MVSGRKVPVAETAQEVAQLIAQTARAAAAVRGKSGEEAD